MLISGFVDKILDLESDLVVLVKEEGASVIKPVKCQVLDTYCCPLILKLSTCTVDYVRNFIDCKKF